nr:immunoglobulin heavy chain junction region [Macaca mulatta]MOY22281.1 immunoglobulin heavy chain junction region [Macaca mulatta]MOY23902.1 immunoglobulin heavy chain junction region [Macaca mulatta]MOY24123.1 immunoglobulin heavy chain junction region [Macaca mulatta]MOY24374.1 immunoglobulin heavy chain junction region [Macaca mulatta]
CARLGYGSSYALDYW